MHCTMYVNVTQDTINRGGLYKVNDAYMLFRAMELATRRVLSVARVNKDPSIQIKHEIHHAIMNDPSVTAHVTYSGQPPMVEEAGKRFCDVETLGVSVWSCVLECSDI